MVKSDETRVQPSIRTVTPGTSTWVLAVAAAQVGQGRRRGSRAGRRPRALHWTTDRRHPPPGGARVADKSDHARAHRRRPGQSSRARRARPLPAEDVELDLALGRVLVEDLQSDGPLPPFDSSAMDGYAVVAGPPAELTVTADSRAGRPAAATSRRGRPSTSGPGLRCPRDPTSPWCRWNGRSPSGTARCACRRPSRGRTCGARARTRAGGGHGGPGAERARPGGARGVGLARPDLAIRGARLAGRGAGHRGRAGPAGPASRPGADQGLQRGRPGGRRLPPGPRWWSGLRARRP